MCNRSHCTLAAALLAATLAPSGCAAGATTTGSTEARPSSQAKVGKTARNGHAKRRTHRRGRPHHCHPPPPTKPRAGSLAYSSASNDVVHSQPAQGSCHAIGTGRYSRPDRACTPGSLNPAVTQATIDRTICASRAGPRRCAPRRSITEQEKAASIAAYGDTASLGDYEYDHFVPLELGGATNDPRNLWPEPGASPNPKDTVEDELRQKVCDGQIALGRGAARDRHQLGAARPPRVAPAERASSPRRHPTHAAECTLSSSYSSSLPRLQRLRPLQPARSDGDRDRRRRPLRHLAHRRIRLRRRLLQNRWARPRASDRRASRPGPLLDNALDGLAPPLNGSLGAPPDPPSESPRANVARPRTAGPRPVGCQALLTHGRHRLMA